MRTPANRIKQGLLASLVGATLYGLAAWNAARPPKIPAFSPLVFQDPMQAPTSEQPFEVNRSGGHYSVAPRFTYTISGLVVSQHDSSSWLDISHAKWGDFLNTKDVCVVWGENLRSGLYARLSYSSGNWTCYAQSRDAETWNEFRKDQLANNHVLPADSGVARSLADLEVGDEITLNGSLVDYRIGNLPDRKTSTIRTDTGNGACEIVWVKDLQLLARHNGFWIRLRMLAQALFAAGLGLIVAGVVMTFRRSSTS